MRYVIVAEAYRDLEQVSSRLALTERLAALLAQTPDGLLPTVCYLCQGLIAPEFAGVDLGLAEKLAIRVVAAVASRDATSGALADLTDKEVRVLRLAALGRTNIAIGHALDISPRTVAKHLEHIYRKLDVNSRTSAVFAALTDRP